MIFTTDNIPERKLAAKRFMFFVVLKSIFVICLLFALKSCVTDKKSLNKSISAADTTVINEGLVKYAISYPKIPKNKLSPFLPHEIDFVFKDKLSCYVISSGLGTVKIVRLLDFTKKEFISLLIDTWGDNYASKDTPEEVKANETLVNYQYIFSDEVKILDGITCKKAMVKNLANNTEFELFYAPDITINNWNSSYCGLNKLLVEYPFAENGMEMQLKAIKIEPKGIDSSFFLIKGDFKWVTKSQFNNHLKSLQK